MTRHLQPDNRQYNHDDDGHTLYEPSPTKAPGACGPTAPSLHLTPLRRVEDRSRHRRKGRGSGTVGRERTPGIGSILGYRNPSWLSADCKDCWKPALV